LPVAGVASTGPAATLPPAFTPGYDRAYPSIPMQEYSMPAARVATLQDMPIFGGIRGEILSRLVELAAPVSIDQGEFFFREGDRAESMYVLESGRVSLLKHWGGAAHILGDLRVGDCFGEMALLDLFPRSASVLAETPCSALELTTSSLQLLKSEDLEQYVLIQMNIARELSRRLRAADERLFRSYIGADDPAAPWTYVA
jgi:CRP-like cAMP-binding protein